MSDEQKPKMGRPREPVPEDIAEAFCEWLSQGRTVADFCRQDGMPSVATIGRWRREDAEFASRVARARDVGFDVIADDCLRIADTPVEGVTTTVDDSEKGGTKIVTEDMLGHRKLQVETRLKLLACWDPRRYGTKQVTVGGIDGGHPIKVEAKAEGPAPPSGAAFDAWATKLAAILTDNSDDAC